MCAARVVQEALKEFFGERLSSDWAGECLGDLVQNPANVNLVVDIAVEYTDAMGGWEKVLAVLEKAPNASQVEFSYLARRIATSEEPEEHYRYIVAASKCQQFQVRAEPCERWLSLGYFLYAWLAAVYGPGIWRDSAAARREARGCTGQGAGVYE